ncbi:hypothetical protein HS088_TW15G00968 [Tripterygium wilfordii]|uniref:Uncharacterized protein n=1 Tax=Tripterygium wilfordii TaxID=458696 RepID=A0A7J7CN02_TRIWF|nr:hypothetical protein HS088_TW15G00968 [Tripterygium wilfordii]
MEKDHRVIPEASSWSKNQRRSIAIAYLVNYSQVLICTFFVPHPGTHDYELHTLSFITNFGKIRFHCTDTPAQEDAHNRREMYADAHCAIVMFDVTSPNLFDNLDIWCCNLRRCNMNIPIVSCRNKVDLDDGYMQQSNIMRASSELKIQR